MTDLSVALVRCRGSVSPLLGHLADHVCQLGHGQATLVLKVLHTCFSPVTKSMHVCAGSFLRGDNFCLVYFVTFWSQWWCLITACTCRCLVFDGHVQVLVLLNNILLSWRVDEPQIVHRRGLGSAICNISTIVLNCASLPCKVVVVVSSSRISTTKNGSTFSLVGRGSKL